MKELYPPAYRAAETRQVMDWIRAGQSGSIVGLRGAGKSYFLYSLCGQEVRQRHLGPRCDDFVFVLTDLLALTECTEWATCELVLDRLLDQARLLGQARPPAVEPEIAAEMAALHREATQARDLFTVERALERCVNALCKQPGRRVVLLLNEFDTVFQMLDLHLFRCLRAIFEAHKGQVSYVVVVSRELADLRSDLAGVDPFYRLVGRNTCYLGPLCEADARYMIEYEAAQRSAALSAEDIARVCELSGGHPATLKAILGLLWDVRRGGSLARLAATLDGEPAVQAECRKVWDGLTEGEQAALRALAAGAQADPGALQRLEYRGLVRADQSGVGLFSPLFAAFVRRQLPPPAGGVIVSHSPRVVQVAGQPVADLTELEFELLYYLYEHRDRVCTKDELIEHVYRQQYERMAGGVSDEALHALVSRLRAKIEPDREHPVYIITVRGEGYRFGERHGQERMLSGDD
jgi:DNA-binding winged helix-turn-helix (wHTH) protein